MQTAIVNAREESARFGKNGTLKHVNVSAKLNHAPTPNYGGTIKNVLVVAMSMIVQEMFGVINPTVFAHPAIKYAPLTSL